MEKKYNMRSPAVKRLMREAIELRNPTPMYFAQPLEENLFEWHFTIRGPEGTEFEGGIYHGRVVLPSEYPMRPPSIILMTPNGRFELHQKICLSASSYHPELWQPSWSIRTVLLAIIGFMPTEGVGAIGSMDCSPEERKKMAQWSLNWTCSVCGTPNKDILPDREENSSQQETMEEAASIVSQMAFKSEAEVQQQKKTLSQQKQLRTEQETSTEPSAVPLPSDHDSPSEPKEQPGQDAVQRQTSSESGGEATDSVGGATGERSVLQRRHQRGSVGVTAQPQPHRTHSPASSGSQAGWFSLLLLWILLLSIAVLVARRLVLLLL